MAAICFPVEALSFRRCALAFKTGAAPFCRAYLAWCSSRFKYRAHKPGKAFSARVLHCLLEPKHTLMVMLTVLILRFDDPVLAFEFLKHSNAVYDCSDASQYYKGLKGIDGKSLKQKLYTIIKSHHAVTYAEVWDALKILDAADPSHPDISSDVIEIYSRRRVPKIKAGEQDGWNREHLWPHSYGLKMGQPEFTDLHNLRPADVNVNSARGNKYYGECSKLKNMLCSEPANVEAAIDTATDRNIWMPPSRVRGDIARAIMYMAVRYGSDKAGGKVTLNLCETPNKGSACMGQMSVLLHWNDIDPPSMEEKLRNMRVCSLYQKNRNPFVDHPEYAGFIWGEGHGRQWDPKIVLDVLKKAMQDMLLWTHHL